MATVNERKAYHALAVAAGGDYRTLTAFAKAHDSWEAAWEAAAARIAVKVHPDRAWEELETQGIRLVLPGDEEYLPLLKEISAPPFGIYLRGARLAEEPVRLAIVGTRRATQAGLRIAKEFARTLAAHGVSIVSGLAFGIDAAAHTGALEGGGSTVAVLGTGVERVYPRSHEALGARMLAAAGTMLSEYPPRAPSFASRFIERNRIIAGMACATLVVEAPENSGALTTARFALDANRDVFVVPGPAGHKNYAGSHRLIRAGAALVASVTDVFEEMGIAVSPAAGSVRPARRGEPGTGGAAEELILKALSAAGRPLGADALAAETKQEIALVQQVLSTLVVRGRIDERGGKYSIV